jgi:tryptophan 6-halogenase
MISRYVMEKGMPIAIDPALADGQRNRYSDGHRVRRVVILGGGTAGWMTASYLGKALQRNVSITLLEAPTIPKIGVGEATVPNLQRVFFDYIGLREEQWMPECNASFKMAVKYINWTTPGNPEPNPRKPNGRSDYFYHPFGTLPNCDHIPLSHHWNYKRSLGETDEPFAHACFKEAAIMDHNLAPMGFDGAPVTYYAWHFDAHLVADFLRRFATREQGVEHVQDELEGVTFAETNGYISGLKTKSGRVIEGDLFIDCSGFRGILINQALAEPFVDMNDQLLCNSAVASAVPHDDARYGIEPYTSAIAMDAGWTWRIPMMGRFGTGYVYSDQFSNIDKAAHDFCMLWNLNPETASLNKIKFRVGRNRRAWVKNCVSIGLSSCFLEPLESSGIYFITAGLYQLVKHFPDKHFDQILIDRFNKKIVSMFDETRDFIQAHFYLSPRIDTSFWRANKELYLSDDIREKIAMYRAGMAINQPTVDSATYYTNFDLEFDNFWTNGSYYSIFAGLGVLPKRPFPLLTYKTAPLAQAEPFFADIKRKQEMLVSSLPTCYHFLQKLHRKDGGAGQSIRTMRETNEAHR